ncbi:MAG: caspase family protein [Muribaculaceae bacterium]|nr:caspase family protein [Muribaculaceae bacterium]
MRAKKKNKQTNKLATESRKRNMLCGIAAMLCFAMLALSCNNQGGNTDSSDTHGTQSAQEQTILGNSSVDSVVTDNDNVLKNDSNDAIIAAATKYKELVITKVESQTSLTSKDFQNSKRKALLIGVGNYTKHRGGNKDTGWDDLSSLNDIALLQEHLIALDFKVVTITDEAATHAGIINALNTLAAKDCCHPGDTLIVHFSGHGQQIVDIVGDEKDNKTETFIPFDALKKPTKEYNMAQNHLKDDEINDYIIAITNKIGANGVLLVTLDACHSENATLGDNKKNGEKHKNTKIRTGDYFQSEELDKLYKKYDESKAKKPRYISHFYALSACKSTEVNYEYKDEAGALGVKDREYGSLSFALCRELANLKKGEKIDFDKLTNAVINHKENNPPLWDCQTPVKETNESDLMH